MWDKFAVFLLLFFEFRESLEGDFLDSEIVNDCAIDFEPLLELDEVWAEREFFNDS